MQPIIATIKPGNTGPEVVNLQDALLALYEREIFKTFDLLNQPTLNELQKLTEGLKTERAQSNFDEATRQLVFYFQIQQSLGDHLGGVVEDTTADKLNVWLKKLGLFDLIEPEGFIVRGTVKTTDGKPLSNTVVYAFDRDLRKEQWLGNETTNERGQYIIRYGSEQFVTGDVPSASAPSLIVRAFASDQQIGDDVIVPKPTRDQLIDFQVPAPQLSEWERLYAGIIPLLAGQGEDDQALPPWELNDNDINFIAEETGLEREKIRLWALAFAVGRDTELVRQPGSEISARGQLIHVPTVPVFENNLSAFAIFYGWFRLGLPTEPVALWATPTETLLTTLSTAITQGIVPSNIGADLSGIRAQIEQLKLDRVLQAPTLGTTTSLGDLLATLPAPLNLDQQRVIAAAVTELRPDDPGLVKFIAGISGFDGDAVGVARTLRLGALTGGHVPLAQALQRRPQLTEETEGTLRPLAALRPDEWLDLAYTHGTPDGITITPAAYADALAASVELQYPTAALAAHLTDGRRLARQPVLTDVGTFLSKNPAFDIVTANLNVLTEQAKLGGVVEPKELEQLVGGLRSLQRMNVLGASWDETATLLENDLLSPHQLLAAGPGQLTALLDGQLAPERVTVLCRQAEELHSTTFAAFTAVFSPLSGPQVLPGKYDVDPINRQDVGGGGQDTELNTETLLKLADLVRLHDLLHLSVSVILAWWSKLVTDTSRMSQLERALGLTTSELVHARALLEVDNPFAIDNRSFAIPGDTLGFCERAIELRNSNITFEDLRYLLQHYEPPGSNLAIDANQLKQLADAAHEAVRSIPGTAKKSPLLTPAKAEEAARAIRLSREDAAIVALATGLGAVHELVDDLLRIRLRHPSNPNKRAIDVFLSSVGDFIDLQSLGGKLVTHSDSVSKYLWNGFSAEDRDVLTKPASTALQQQTTLVLALNEVLQGASIYEASRFAGITLSEEALKLNEKNPTGADLIRLNRLLLEDAYPLEIVKHQSPDMSFIVGDVSQPRSDAINAAIKSVVVRLHKALLICEALKLSRAGLRLLRTSATDKNGFKVLDFDTLPVQIDTTPASVSVPAKIDDFEQLLRLVQLCCIAPGAADLLHQYAAIDFDAAGSAGAVHKILASGLGLEELKVVAAVNQLHITAVDHYRDPIALTRLIELLVALKQLGATVNQATASGRQTARYSCSRKTGCCPNCATTRRRAFARWRVRLRKGSLPVTRYKQHCWAM